MSTGNGAHPSFKSMQILNDFEDGFTDSVRIDDEQPVGRATVTSEPEVVKPAPSQSVRPSRNKDRTTYSDYYRITRSPPARSRTVDVSQGNKDVNRESMISSKRIKVNQVATTEVSSAHLGRAPRPSHPNALHTDITPQGRIGSTPEVGPTQGELNEEGASVKSRSPSVRERAMTSPLSSVPSDLDDAGDVGGTPTAPTDKHESRRKTRPSDNRSLDSSSLLAMPTYSSSTGKKRGPPGSADGRHSDKKNKKSKRIKISSPAKHRKESPVELGVLPQDSRSKPKAETDVRMRVRDDDQGSNDGHCSACQGTGKLLCCDDCPRSFHFTCIEPPIEEADIPDVPYFCMSCWDKRYGFPRPPPGLFHDLLVNEITRDPVMFSLPEGLREYFDNVSTGEQGVYQEANEQKTLRKDRHGFAEELDPHRLRDRQNRPVLCYRCGKSALGTAGILSCDHCSAHWHFDCINPPLHGPPSATKKWMCPLHAHDVTPTLRKQRQPRTIDVSLTRGFKNNGDVEVEVSEVEDLVEDSSSSETDEEANDQTSMSQRPYPRHKFRLPSRGIILDFLDTCRPTDCEGEERLIQALPFDGSAEPEALRVLVDIALKELSRNDVETSTRSELASEHSERVQLLALKAMMQLKGRDKLLEWLATM